MTKITSLLQGALEKEAYMSSLEVLILVETTTSLWNGMLVKLRDFLSPISIIYRIAPLRISRGKFRYKVY